MEAAESRTSINITNPFVVAETPGLGVGDGVDNATKGDDAEGFVHIEHGGGGGGGGGGRGAGVRRGRGGDAIESLLRILIPDQHGGGKASGVAATGRREGVAAGVATLRAAATAEQEVVQGRERSDAAAAVTVLAEAQSVKGGVISDSAAAGAVAAAAAVVTSVAENVPTSAAATPGAAETAIEEAEMLPVNTTTQSGVVGEVTAGSAAGSATGSTAGSTAGAAVAVAGNATGVAAKATEKVEARSVAGEEEGANVSERSGAFVKAGTAGDGGTGMGPPPDGVARVQRELMGLVRSQQGRGRFLQVKQDTRVV